MANGNSSAIINVTNNTGNNISQFQLVHEYSDSWIDGPSPAISIAAGKTAESVLVAHFNAGFLYTGRDYWYVQFMANGIWYTCTSGSLDDPNDGCTMDSDDNGKVLTFSVSEDTFSVNLTDKNCTFDISTVDDVLATAGKKFNREG